MTPDTKPQNLSPNEQQDLDNRLIAAASNGNTATVQTLLAHGADVHARNDHALRRAADTGHTETVKVLLAAGADIHAIDDQALRWAAEGGCTETVNLLLAHDADVHALDDGALRVAVDNGHTETVKALIASGADVHAEDDWALRLAAFNSHLETVQALAKHIFAPDAWRGKSRAEIEAHATALYDKIEAENPQPDRLQKAATILADCAIDCWHQVRPPPPKLQISPLPAQPRPV
jgi:ankyrin repeat protein